MPHLRRYIYALFLLSGCASLICEVLWFKQLQLIVGVSTLTVSLVVAIFFAGLSIGSALGGRLAHRISYPLLVYGVIEIVIGFLTIGVSLLLSSWRIWSVRFLPWLEVESFASNFVVVFFCCLILLPPTVLMGSTLPILSQFITDQVAGLRNRLGMLYALNTFGGAIGCAAVGFFLIGWIGVSASAFIAAFIYGAIGSAAIALFVISSKEQSPVITPIVEADPLAEGLPVRSIAVSIALISGFTAIGYEVLWFRLLAGLTNRTTYVFTSMLSIYLLGLVFGSVFSSLKTSVSRFTARVRLAELQLFIAASVLLSFVALGEAPLIAGPISAGLAAIGLPKIIFGSVSRADVCVSILSFVILILPTAALGMSLPLAVDLLVPTPSRAGAGMGTYYALNTLAGVAGSALTVFLLLPVIGIEGSFALMVGLNLLLFFLLNGQRKIDRSHLLLFATLLFGFVYCGPHYLKIARTRYPDARVLSFSEQPDATYVVLGYEDAVAGKYQQVVVNGTSYANNRPEGRRYMSLLGHLPVLLHPSPKSAAVIAIGTGTTVGSLTLHPELERITAIDVSPEIFRIAPYFEPINQKFTASPKVKMVVADGRRFLLGTRDKFDVLTFEPPPPIEAGIVNLYSTEFYKIAKARLSNGGILCQWLPFHESAGREVLHKMLLQSILEAFPHVSLWVPNNEEGILIASDHPLSIDPAELARRMNIPAVRDNLHAIGVDDVGHLLGTFVAADETLRAYVQGVPSVTDDLPRIEHYNRYPLEPFKFSEIAKLRTPVAAQISGDKSFNEEAGRSVVDLIWAIEHLRPENKGESAQSLLGKAEQLEPGNEYLAYLARGIRNTR